MLLAAFLPDHPRDPPDEMSPNHSLTTPLPASYSVAPFIPPPVAIPYNMRSQIIAGNDINLVKILLCSSGVLDERIVGCGDISVVLIVCDRRFFKSVASRIQALRFISVLISINLCVLILDLNFFIVVLICGNIHPKAVCPHRFKLPPINPSKKMNKHPSTLINIHKLSNDLSFHPTAVL